MWLEAAKLMFFSQHSSLLDSLLKWTIVKTYKTTTSASYGPVLRCYGRVL